MIKITDFLNYKSLCGINLSSDESKIAYIVQQPELKRNGYKKELWTLDTASNKTTKHVDEMNATTYAWKDANNILFHGNVTSDSATFNNINVNTNEVTEAFTVSVPANKIAVIGNGEYILTAPYQNPQGEYPAELAFLKENDDQFITIDELPYWTNGVGYTNKKRNRIYYYNNSTKELTPISQPLAEVGAFQITPKGVVYIATTFKDKKSLPGVYQYNTANGEHKCLVEEGIFRISYANYILDKFYFVAADSRKSLMTCNPKLHTMDENGNISIAIDEDISFTNTVLTDCKYGSSDTFRVYKDELYFVSTEGTSSFIKKVSSDMSVTTITADNGSVEGFVMSDNGIYFTGLRGIKLEEMYLLAQGEESQLTSINEGVMDYKKVNLPEKISFENNGFNVNYVVLKPECFDAAKKYPAILFIHGGAKTLYTSVFFHEMQFLASKGYFVVYGNPRGSDGQGSEFAKLQGNYGKPDFSDLMKAMDTAIEKYPQIDVDKLAVAGGSYGGIMTNWTIGHTDRFKCACAQRSISNMFTAFGAADNGFNFVREQMDSDPWSNFDLLWEQSPLKYANKVKTPLLLIHADEDYRCHYVEAMQMFTALKYHNVESKICLIKGENHDLSRTGRPVQRIKRMYEISSWFDKFLV